MSVLRTVTGNCALAIMLAAAAGPAQATLDSTAVATGTGPGSVGEVRSEPVTISVPLAAASFTAVVSAAAMSVASGAVETETDGGDTLTWRIAVTNTGAATLAGVTLSPVLLSIGGGEPFELPNGATLVSGGEGGPIAPGATFEYEVAYTLTQADVDAAAGAERGLVFSTGASARTAGGAELAADAAESSLNVESRIEAKPMLTLVKSAVGAGGEPVGEARAGDVITWRFTVVNTGNVTVSGVTIGEQNFNGLAGNMPAPSIVTGDTTLSPGETAVFESTYTVGQSDVDTLQ